MKHRVGVLVLALGIGAPVAAQAQPAPPAPAPAPPPPAASPSADLDAPPAVLAQADPSAPPPAANPNAPPAPPPPGDASAPAAPPPVTLPPYLSGQSTVPLVIPPAPGADTSANGSNAPGPDTVRPDKNKKMPARVVWRGTNISWNNSFSAQTLGVGKDYQSGSGQQAVTGLNLAINYFLIDKKEYKLRAQTSFAFDTELTNSDTTTKKFEPLFRDIPLQLILSKPLWKSANEEWAISSAFNGTILLPTSKASYDRGIYTTVSPRASLFAQVPILGNKSPYLKNVFLGVSARYDHQFSRANVPTNPDIDRVRQLPNGSTAPNDQLTGGLLASDSFRTGAFAFFDELILGGHFWLSLGAGLSYGFLNQAGGDDGVCVMLATGCAKPGRVNNPTTTRYNTSFSVSVNYFPSSEWGIGLGYDNAAPQLAPDSTRSYFFYSPNAEFSASVIVSIDAIYERITGPAREEPVIYFGKNKGPKTPVPPMSTATF